MWFSLTAVAFLAMYVCALFWKRTTKEGAIAGLVIGTVYTVFSFLFINHEISNSTRNLPKHSLAK
jgi:SSS family solute:Na+ symporter